VQVPAAHCSAPSETRDPLLKRSIGLTAIERGHCCLDRLTLSLQLRLKRLRTCAQGVALRLELLRGGAASRAFAGDTIGVHNRNDRRAKPLRRSGGGHGARNHGKRRAQEEFVH
jgi:hypothetical protein